MREVGGIQDYWWRSTEGRFRTPNPQVNETRITYCFELCPREIVSEMIEDSPQVLLLSCQLLCVIHGVTPLHDAARRKVTARKGERWKAGEFSVEIERTNELTIFVDSSICCVGSVLMVPS